MPDVTVEVLAELILTATEAEAVAYHLEWEARWSRFRRAGVNRSYGRADGVYATIRLLLGLDAGFVGEFASCCYNELANAPRKRAELPVRRELAAGLLDVAAHRTDVGVVTSSWDVDDPDQSRWVGNYDTWTGLHVVAGMTLTPAEYAASMPEPDEGEVQ
jgi:hypothetical protein